MVRSVSGPNTNCKNNITMNKMLLFSKSISYDISWACKNKENLKNNYNLNSHFH